MAKKRVLLFFSSLTLSFGLLVAADRAVGLYTSRHEQTAGIIFPPNAKRHFQTMEFSFNLETNSLGFRDREFGAGGRATVRILALGDSFTYGWGVEIDQAWPKVLESRLRAFGHDVEVANLGKPAGSPKDYADIAEKATPILKPDLIVVAVLQGDDLAQMEQVIQSPAAAEEAEDKKGNGPQTTGQKLRAAATWLYPNFFTLLNERVKPQPTLDYQWKEDAQVFLWAMSPEGKARFENLDARIEGAFVNGELNPALVYLGVIKPDYFLQTLDVHSTRVRTFTLEMARQLARIKKVALENGAEAVVVSVPYGVYVSASSLKSRQRLGFSVAPEMLTTDAPDEVIRSASEMAGLRFYNATGDFRQFSTNTDLFFELDGHFNLAGHRHFGEVLAPLIEKKISAPDWRLDGSGQPGGCP